MRWLIVYLAIAGMLGILAVLSRKEKLYTGRKLSTAEAVLRRMAVYLYRRSRQRGAGKGRPAGSRFSAGEVLTEKVRRDLAILHPSVKPEGEMARHRIRQLQTMLTFALAADLLGIAIWISERGPGSIRPDGSIERPGYEEPALTVTARAEADTQNGQEEYGEYRIVVGSRKYTGEEAEKMAEQALEELEEEIAGDNRGLHYVTGNLQLLQALGDYPFRISWESSNYGVIDADGTVYSDRLEQGEHQSVQLTATLTYEGNSWSRRYEVMVFPKLPDGEEALQERITEELEQEEADSAEKSFFFLPAVIDGTAVRWTQVREESGQWIFLLILVAGGAAAFEIDRELHQKVLHRDRELTLDYPLIVSKITLFLGAGMSIRNIFLRLGEDYRAKRRKGGEKRYVYEEIVLVCRELENGIPETSAYAEFGRRCHTRQYAKLGALLAANQIKGNGALLKALQEEADRSFEERRGIARQMGEEAGTKLLLPMLMMLGITLVIIMIPAYFSFSL